MARNRKKEKHHSPSHIRRITARSFVRIFGHKW